MKIKKLNVENLRNLEHVTIEPDERLNFLLGDNGAGKTSVLEAIAVLSSGRSFRTSRVSDLTGPAAAALRVFATARDQEGKEHRLGLERSSSHWLGRIDGNDVHRLSELSRLMPIVVLEPESHQLVSGPPEIRRRLLDWGMFHVEPSFLEHWRAFSRALKQRNAALRLKQVDVLDGLDEVLSRHGDRLHQMRETHADQLARSIEPTLAALKARLREVKLSYLPGWRGETYRMALANRRERDLDQGTTGSGPHRADLGIDSEGNSARAVLSRGEQKALAAALVITQAKLIMAQGRQPVFLLDDLYSEFDQEHFDSVLEEVLATGGQVWMTGTERPALPEPHRVFHVEQGRVNVMV